MRKNSTLLLNTFIKWTIENDKSCIDVSNALKFAITHQQLECQNILLRHMKDFAYTTCRRRNLINCAVVTVILNRHDVLESVLNMLPDLTFSSRWYESELSEVCLRLARPECTHVLKWFGIDPVECDATEDTVHGLIKILDTHLDSDSGEIVSILKSIPDIETRINRVDEKGRTVLKKL